jgi:lysyl-tRNA synthetase class 2
MLSSARAFFKQRNVLEVDCPALSQAAPIDAHIDVMQITMGKEIGYLHTSPEYGMKRLLSEGIGDIYQLSHVFRQEEYGRLHNPEFMMVEWYRVGFSFDALIEETLDFIRLFLKKPAVKTYTYREVLKEHTGIDYLTTSQKELSLKARQLIHHLPEEALQWNKDTLLNCLMSFVVEPHLSEEEFSVIKYFPSSQAALSKIKMLGEEPVAERFEIYYKGIELANGYHELTCPLEQRRRFIASNEHRLSLGKNALPIDDNLIQALEQGLPDCCGVAVGFDRLMLLRHNKDHIEEILPFSWPRS